MPLTPEQRQELQELRRLAELEAKFGAPEAERPGTAAGAAQAALEGGAQVATGGHLAQAQAGVETLLEALGLDPSKGLDEELKAKGFDIPERSYVQRRDEEIARQKRQEEQYPKASLAGKAAGIGVTLPLAAAKTIPAAAGIGALYNPGDVPGQTVLDRPVEELTGRAKGAALGAGVGAAAKGLSGVGRGLTARKEAVTALKDKTLGDQLRARTQQAVEKASRPGAPDVPVEVDRLVSRIERSPVATFRGAKAGRDSAEALKKLDELAGDGGLSELSDVVTSAERSLLDPVRLVKPLEAPNELRRMLFRSAMQAGPTLEKAGGTVSEDVLLKALLEGTRDR